jgi:DNA-binding CsgD family transcriptional regulator/PAS domain-containing protein
MADDDRRVLDLIDEIYGAALDSSRWPIFIESLSRVFGGIGGVFQQRERQSAEVGFIEIGGMDAAARAAYEQYYRARSVWMPAAFVSSSELTIGHELAPDKRLFEQSEFYNDWLRPNGGYDAIGGVVQRSSGSLTVVTVIRAERAGLVTDGEKKLFARLMPHVRRAIDIHRRFCGVKLQRDGTLRALDALQVGIVLADRRGRVMFANRVAEEILRRGDGLGLVRDQLRAARPEDSQKLAALIEGAARTTLGLGERPGGILALPTSAGIPVTVLVSPCPRLHLLEPAAFVFIGQPTGSMPIDERHVARKHGLTPAEARLLRALYDGKRLSEYAASAGITINTAKTHLKHLFAKTGTERQADLVRMFVADPVLRLAAFQTRG